MSEHETGRASLGLHRAAVSLVHTTLPGLRSARRSARRSWHSSVNSPETFNMSAAPPWWAWTPSRSSTLPSHWTLPTGVVRTRSSGAWRRGGYEYPGDQGPDGGLLFVRATGDVRTVHVHMVAVDDPEWTSYIRFRDYLRATPQRRDDYQQLKRQLAARYAADRGAYTEGKTAFVLETLRLAGK